MVSGQPPRRRRNGPEGERSSGESEEAGRASGSPTELSVNAHVLGDVASRRLAKAAAAAGAAAAGSISAASEVAAVELAAATTDRVAAESVTRDSLGAPNSAEIAAPKPRKPRKGASQSLAAAPPADQARETAAAATVAEPDLVEPAAVARKPRKTARRALGPVAPSVSERFALLSAAATMPIDHVADPATDVPAPAVESAAAQATPPEPAAQARIEELTTADGISNRVVDSRFVAGLGMVALGVRTVFGFAGAAAAFVAAPVGHGAGWWRRRRAQSSGRSDAAAPRPRRRRPTLAWILFTAFYLTLGSALVFQGVVVPIMGHSAATETAGHSPANLIVGQASSSPSLTASPTDVAPSADPTAMPTTVPTATATAAPTAGATRKATPKPTLKPTAKPNTPAPTAAPTAVPTPALTPAPTALPTAPPTLAPTATPTATVTGNPGPTPTQTMVANIMLVTAPKVNGDSGIFGVTSLGGAICHLHRTGGAASRQPRDSTNFTVPAGGAATVSAGGSVETNGTPWGKTATGYSYTITVVCTAAAPDGRTATSVTPVVMPWP
jgi:hypothetical protein